MRSPRFITAERKGPAKFDFDLTPAQVAQVEGELRLSAEAFEAGRPGMVVAQIARATGVHGEPAFVLCHGRFVDHDAALAIAKAIYGPDTEYDVGEPDPHAQPDRGAYAATTERGSEHEDAPTSKGGK